MNCPCGKVNKMRILGIDPGTGSFDFFGMDGDSVICDTTISVEKVAQNPEILLETCRSVFPLDMIIGPSGYGLPVTPVSKVSQRELDLMVPDDKSIPLYDGIRRVIMLMKEEHFPVYFTPGVIHLQTVPLFRKANRIDMGTADKVCCAALAIRDQAENLGIDFSKTCFILAEIGFAFNAILGVENGKIVDGFGGTSTGPGFLTSGCMDSELAIRLGKFPGIVLFSGGAKDICSKKDITPEELAEKHEQYPDSWNMLIESVVKGVAAMTSVVTPKEILLTGRLTRIPLIEKALKEKLSRFGHVRKPSRIAKNAKEAAEGAYILGSGLSGGKYQGIVDSMEIRNAKGSMYDYLFIKGVELPHP
jgi:predicted butyrate kinase (DUF1464 family)